MTAPYGFTGGPKKNRGTGSQIPMSQDDSLAVEAYGAAGAAMRKTAAVGVTGDHSSGPQQMVESGKAAVRGVVEGVKSVVHGIGDAFSVDGGAARKRAEKTQKARG